MRTRLNAILIWALIAALAGAATHLVFNASFWVGAGVAIFSLAGNGLFIEWEDRQPGGWSE